jgi:hypothetical protein
MIATFLLLAIVLSPHISVAMTVEMFDALALEDQRDYLELLVERSQDVLIQQDRRDLAEKVKDMFRKRRGDDESRGEAHFRKQLAASRDYVAREDVKALHIQILPGEVEGALIGTLQNNGVPMSNRLFKALSEAWKAKPFWPKRPLRTPSADSPTPTTLPTPGRP